MCNSLGIGCVAGSATGGGSSGVASAGAPPGSVVQNCIGPATAGSEIRKFRVTGTILLRMVLRLIRRQYSVGVPAFWLRNRAYGLRKFSVLSNKHVAMAFKNPHQQYNTISGTQTVSGFDHSAKF